EGDVEFARQIVERAVVDDDLRELLHERQCVNQLVRVDARRGIAREIANVVRTRAAGLKSDILNAAQYFRRVLRLDEAKLKVGAGGNLHIAAGQFLRNARELAKLK